MECQHKNISRGISLTQGRYFSFCLDCGKKWHDNGKRWENDPKAQAKVREWELSRK